MKAYKQINLGFEKRIVFSYAALLCFIGSFIILSPVLAQDSDTTGSNDPEIRINVQKQFDDQGNVIGYDSTYTWYWSGKEISDLDFDSIFEQFNYKFDHLGDCFKKDHFQPFGYFQHPGWQWDDKDSSWTSGLDEFFDEFNENRDDYLDRIRKYNEEHKKLIEKYFGEPSKKNDPDFNIDRNKYSPENEKIQSGKTGRI